MLNLYEPFTIGELTALHRWLQGHIYVYPDARRAGNYRTILNVALVNLDLPTRYEPVIYKLKYKDLTILARHHQDLKSSASYINWNQFNWQADQLIKFLEVIDYVTHT